MAALDAWLDEVSIDEPELRDPALLKLLLLDPDAGARDSGRIHRLASSRAAEHRRRAEHFDRQCASGGSQAPGAVELHRLAGELERTSAAFWAALAERGTG